jgi:serine/threonine protein kinase
MNGIDGDKGEPGCLGASPSRMAAALEAYEEALFAGHAVNRAAMLSEHADVAGALADCLDALELIHEVANGAGAEGGDFGNPSPLQVGDVLGKFRIAREIGRGGMGIVYEAEQLDGSAARVALKVLPGAASFDTCTYQRFRIETQAAACLKHPNIVPLIAVGCARGTPYYAMPLIRGRSLAQILEVLRAERRTARLSRSSEAVERNTCAPWPITMARLGLQAAEALEHAHSLGIIHRDIKPSNLLVEDSGRLWVTDFGLARIMRDDTRPTRTGDLVGTLRYVSPEQVRGEVGAGDERADIYALGATLYEALTLRPAFEAVDREALLFRILHADPVRPRRIEPAIPEELETIVLKAMDKLTSGRYATASDLAADLGRFLENRPIRARKLSLAERACRWSKKHRGWLASAIVAIIVSMGIATVALWRSKRQVDATLIKIRDARIQERLAFEGAFSINEAITLPLIEEATSAGVWDKERRLYAYRELIAFFDRIAEVFAADDHQLEVVAKALRRAGGMRLAIGDRRGCRDYSRAIELYEVMSARTPQAIWYRTGLISTLREFSGILEQLGDREAALARRRRAYEIAEGLLVDENATLRCFRKTVLPEFVALIGMLREGCDAAAAQCALGDRLRKWVEEHR